MGITWDTIPMNFPPYSTTFTSNSFDFLNINHGMFYSEWSNKLFLYHYGDTTLLPDLSLSGYTNISTIKMISPAKAFIICNSGNKLITTNDTGSIWVESLDTGITMNHVEFLNPSVGYVSCNGGIVYKTIDGGITWNLITTGTIQDLYYSSFYNDTLGYFAGNLGTILRTKDGGLTWSDQSMPWLGTIRKIKVSATSAYCYDDNAIVYRTSNVNGISEDQPGQNTLSLFPNPAKNQFTISNPPMKKINSIQLLNSLGQLEYSQTIGNNNAQIKVDLPPLPAGIKYCRINGEENFTYKIIIE